MAEQMVQGQKKQLRSSKSFEDDILELNPEEREKEEKSCKTSDVGKKPSKSDSKCKNTTSSSKNASSTSGKMPSKMHSNVKNTIKTVADVHSNADSSKDSNIMSILGQILENQRKQDEKISDLNNKVNAMEYEEYDEDYIDLDENANEIVETEKQQEARDKRKSDEVETESRFHSMSKRFKSKEVCDSKIDETLASNLTDLFRNGMNDEQYSELTKDDNNARPENCEGLKVVKTNQLVWDIISPEAKTNDRKMQNIETSLIKGSIILAKIVNKLAILENDINDDEHKSTIGQIIDECNDILALFGQTNRQINMTRRDLIKPELRYEYLHLCAQSVPYTAWLFGDDISKTAKEIEDCSKVGNKLYNNRGGSYRGRMRGRFRGRSRARGRSSYSQTGYQSYSQSYGYSGRGGTGHIYSKNYKRAGTSQQKSKT
ncbi:hypothetical protein FSP39_003008 [Pinctada imbricata]|uniref:Uncharacterized protein n=1 Tax=Pinctada imbricata TaxID=66713 RepID=A0AA89BSC1_PINIB|nr:hypothetical protein FSP39_003008 [Pinctada imbricata]